VVYECSTRVIKSRVSGTSSDPQYDKYRTFKNEAMNRMSMEGVTIVRSESEARKVVEVL
jgi:hypothetical protein